MASADVADYLVTAGALQQPGLVAAFRHVDRADFVPADLRYQATVNAPLPIGYGQTISQPLTVALMLEWLDLKPGQRVLDVGAGSGWQTALLAHVVAQQPGGLVLGLERIPALAAFGQANLAKRDYARGGAARIVGADGSGGWPAAAPYDRIVVAAAAPQIPTALLQQLAVGGRLVIPVGRSDGQDIVVVDKTGPDAYKEQRHPGFAFVPFVSSEPSSP